MKKMQFKPMHVAQSMLNHLLLTTLAARPLRSGSGRLQNSRQLVAARRSRAMRLCRFSSTWARSSFSFSFLDHDGRALPMSEWSEAIGRKGPSSRLRLTVCSDTPPPKFSDEPCFRSRQSGDFSLTKSPLEHGDGEPRRLPSTGGAPLLAPFLGCNHLPAAIAVPELPAPPRASTNGNSSSRMRACSAR